MYKLLMMSTILSYRPDAKIELACRRGSLSITALLLIVSPTFGGHSPSRQHGSRPLHHSRSHSFLAHHRLQPIVNLQGGGINIDDDISTIDETKHNNDFMYASIGALSFGTANNQLTGAPPPKFILSYRDNDLASQTVHWELENSDNGASFAAAETMGCLCHGIILKLQTQALVERDIEKLDDFLSCIAEGIIRRVKSTEDVTEEDLVVPVMLTFQNEEDHKKGEAIAEQIHQYLNAAVSCIQDRDHKDGGSTEKRISVQVSTISGDESEASKELSKRTTANQIAPNLVPHAMFGELANSMHKNICNRLSSTQNYDAFKYGEWTLTSEKYSPHKNPVEEEAPMQQLSQGFQRTIESLMAMLFVDTEDALQEIESRIDEAYFQLNNHESLDDTIPQFGSDFDGVLNIISKGFVELVDADTSLTDYDREWANAQRLVTMEQVASTSMQRLYHSHLQNLRDHYGRMYESALDEFSTSQGGNKSFELERREAARRAEEGFTQSALDSIPQMCRHPDGELCEEMSTVYSCVESLRGLLKDMYEITSSRMLDEEEWDDIMDADVESVAADKGSKTGLFKQKIGLRQLIKKIREERQKRGPAKWYERWAGKLLIIGLNYIQGWLALQTLRREARKRDQDMPKFPLF